MKTIIILLFTSSILLAQENKYILHEPQSQTSDFKILSSCGITGIDSEEFKYFRELIFNKNYSEISNNLKSTNVLNRVISVIVLEELTNQKLFTPSKDEINAITVIKTLNNYYHLCSGCTTQSSGTVSSIFYSDASSSGSIDIIRLIKNKVGF